MNEQQPPPPLHPPFAPDPDPGDPEFGRNLFANIHKLWVTPEIERRKEAKTLPDDFMVYQCRVLFVPGGPPKIEFNDEIGWNARIRRGESRPIQKGEAIYFHDVRSIETVYPPEVEGNRVGFLYLFHRGGGVYGTIFNFDRDAYPDDDADWDLGRPIAEHLNTVFREKVVRQFGESAADLLRAFGLFMAPGIMPYPLTAIVAALQQGDEQKAQDLLDEECGTDFWQARMASWWAVPLVRQRQAPIQESVHAHCEGHYHACIYTVYPVVVGLLGDYIVSRDANLSTITRDAVKAARFAEFAHERLPNSFAWKRILSAPLEFIADGPFFASFRDWNEPISEEFPSRHAVAHGKYDPKLFTKETSIRSLLLLDALVTVLSAIAEPKGPDGAEGRLDLDPS